MKSLYCGLTALLGGLGIFLLWVPTRWSALESVGVAWIAFGSLLVVAGLGFLFFEAARMSRRRTIGTLTLLLGNFPVAFWIIVLVNHLNFPTVDVEIADPTRATVLTLQTTEEYPNTLLVEVRGALAGSARFRMDDRGEWLQVGPGKVDTQIRGGDYYHSEAKLQYEPLDVRGGTLRVTYQFR